MLGLSLFSGIGGLDLAFEQAGGQVKAMCEIDSFCQTILRRHWPDVPVFGDIKELHGSNVGTVDVIYGGFPCQPFSVAGKQRGKDDSRYMWPEFSRLVSEIKPRWVVAENVPGILRIASDEVCRDLERQGYRVGIWDFEAASIGARHRRERIFFVAHSGCSLRQGISEAGDLRGKNEEGITPAVERSGCPPAADSYGEQCEEQRQRFRIPQAQFIAGCNGGWELESGMGRTVNGLPHRVDRLRALGNAVVPQQVYPVFRAIMEADKAYE